MIDSNLSVFPYIRELQYASNIDVSELNKMLSSLDESSLRAVYRGKKARYETDQLFLAVIKSFEALSSRVNSMTYSSTDNAVASAYTPPMINTGDLNYDHSYGQTTLKQVSSFSKIPRGNGYDGKVSPSVKMFIGQTEIFPDNPMFNILDGTNNSFWIKEVDPDSNHEIRIDLPPSITKRFNYIEIFPFPVYGMVISKVEYTTTYGRRRDVLADVHGTNNPLMNNSGESVKLYLSPKDFNGTIYITVKAGSLGVIGFSNVDIKFIDFDNNASKGFTRFDTISSHKPSSGTRSMIASSAQIDYWMDYKNLKDVVQTNQSSIKAWIKSGVYDQITKDIVVPSGGLNVALNLNNTNVLSNETPFTLGSNDDVWFVYELSEYNLTTPVINGCKMTFKDA